jgi:hypothetical protein
MSRRPFGPDDERVKGSFTTGGVVVNLTRVSFVAAPALMAGYGVVRLATDRGPGLGWTVGHLLMLAGLVLFAWVIAGLRRAGAGIAANVFAAIAYVGLAASIVQIGVDIVVGLISADKAEKSRHFEAIQAVPGVLPLVYTVVPLFFYLGAVALSILAATTGPRLAPGWTPVLILLGTVAAGLSLDYIPVAGLLYLIALTPLALRAPRVASNPA